jgi:hypothetical protein
MAATYSDVTDHSTILYLNTPTLKAFVRIYNEVFIISHAEEELQ